MKITKTVKKEIKTENYAGGLIGTPEAYDRGYSCGLIGPNDYNSNFRIFSTPENTKAWEEGKKDGENAKKLKP